uniref:Non-specific serine/threonine protein kinase n=1 Tax=Davidia involucrata TaxID=16924 RepID=A0A5B7BSX4_DAVIN
MSELIIHYSPAHIAELLYFRHNVHKQDDIIAMGSSLRQISFLILIIHLVGLTLTFAQPELLYFNCTYSANYSSSSTTYGTNLNTLLSSLSSNIDRYGYNNSSIGKDPDRVTAVALCRGDVELNLCRSCVNDSISKLTQLCPNQREAIAWYDNCMLRYTNQAIVFGKMVWGPGFNKWNDKLYVPDEYLSTFHEVRRTLLLSLRDQAAAGNSRRKYATGDEQLQNYQTIYSLVQCTPDLSGTECSDCLNACMELIPDCCNRSMGGAVYKPTCNLRYELGTGAFYNATVADPPEAPPLLPPPDTLVPSGKKSNSTTRTVIIIVVPTVIFVILVYISICLRQWRQTKQKLKLIGIHEAVDGISTPESLQYDFATVRDATDDFSDTNKLGQGGFGPVYKGRRPNGQEFAVKRLSKGSGQGEAEFKNEVLLVAKLRHRNLVRLLGFCLEGTERLLIYEFVTNGSLDHFIFDTINGAKLDWNKRYKIIGGIAKGLLYLHEDSRLRIIHRDLKASNILLDAEMNAKISDFGMARCFVLDETQGNISASRIAGTYGYMAPEVLRGHISVKSDVFSFGVLVLETVSGQKISKTFGDEDNAESLLSYAWKMWREGTASNLIEPTMRNNSGSIGEITRCIHIGLLYVQENVANRPTMASVVLMLSSISLTLAVPSRPAFFLHSTVETEMPLLGPSHIFTVNEASITELYPR